MPSGLQTVLRGAGAAAFDPALFPGAAFYVDTSRSTITKANAQSGTGATLTKSGSTITVTGATGLAVAHAGGTITLAGYGAGNNGKFTMLTAVVNGCTYTNAAGASEAGSGAKTWSIEGQCVGITELVSGLTLTQPGTITNQLSINTSDNPSGKPVIGSTTSGQRWLTLDSTTVAGKMNGAGPSTWFTYFSPVFLSGAGCLGVQFRDQIIGVTPGSLGHLQLYVAADNGKSIYLVASAGNATTFSMPAGVTWIVGQWYALACVYDGNTNTDWYVDGAYVSTATIGLARTLNALRTVTIGTFGGTNASFSNAGGYKIAGVGTWKAALSATRIAELHAYFRGWQP